MERGDPLAAIVLLRELLDERLWQYAASATASSTRVIGVADPDLDQVPSIGVPDVPPEALVKQLSEQYDSGELRRTTGS